MTALEIALQEPANLAVYKGIMITCRHLWLQYTAEINEQCLSKLICAAHNIVQQIQ